MFLSVYSISIASNKSLIKISVYLSFLLKLSTWNLLVTKWKMWVQGRDSSGACCPASISVHGFQTKITSSTFVLGTVSLLLTTWGEMQTVDENRMCPFAAVNDKPSFINSRCILRHLWLMLTDSTCIWNQPASYFCLSLDGKHHIASLVLRFLLFITYRNNIHFRLLGDLKTKLVSKQYKSGSLELQSGISMKQLRNAVT